MFHLVRMLGALLGRTPPSQQSRGRRVAQMTDTLIVARRALLASRPLRPHQADLAAHLRAVAEIDLTLSGPARVPKPGLPGAREAMEFALQHEAEHDLILEQAKGFDGWIGHPDWD